MTEQDIKFGEIGNALKNVNGDNILGIAKHIYDTSKEKTQEEINEDILGDDPDSLKSKVNSFTGIVIGQGEDVVSSDPADIVPESPKVPTGNAVAGVIADMKTEENNNTTFKNTLLKPKDVGIDDEPTVESDNLVKSGGVFDCVNIVEPLSKKTKLSLWGYYVSNVNTGAISAANSNYNGYIARVNPNFNYIVFGSLSYTGKPVCCYNGFPSTSTFIGLVTNSTGDIRKYSLISGTKYIVMTVPASSEEEIFIEAIASVGTYSLELQDNYVVCSSGANNNKVVNAEGMLNKRHFFVKFTNANTHISPTLKLQNPLREDVTLPLYYNDSQVSSSNTYQAGEIVEIIRDDDNEVFRGYKFSRGVVIDDGSVTTPKLANNSVTTDKLGNGSVIKEKMGYNPLDDLNTYGNPENIVIGLSGSTEEVLSVARALIKNVRMTNIPEGYTPGCMRLRQIRCNLKSTSSMTLQLQFFAIINNAASNVDTVTFIVSSSSTGTTVVSGTYCEVTVDLDNWDLENLFTDKTDYYYNKNVDNPYQVIPSNDFKFINGKILEDGSISESKLDNSVKEKLNGIGSGSSFLYGKKLVTLCDSLGNLSQWQTRLAELTGAVYDSILNNGNYSIGGTKTLWADQNGLDGQSRAKKLVQDNLVVPDVIVYENVNDNSDLSNGSSSDESFFRSQQSIITPGVTLTTQQEAEDYWTNNLATIVAGFTPQAGTILGVPFQSSNGVKLKITGIPVASGNITINLTVAGSQSITVEAGESVSSIIAKILEYDWLGYTDIIDPNDPAAVIFTKIDGNTPATFTIDVGNTGVTYTTDSGITGTLCVWKYFYGHDLSMWSNSSCWVNKISRWSMWKGVYEYLQTHFPNALIYWLIPSTWKFDYNNLSGDQLYPDGSPNYSYIMENNALYKSLTNANIEFCDYYNIPVINLRKEAGINPMNVSTFCNVNNVHPKQTGYNRWADVIAKYFGK